MFGLFIGKINILASCRDGQLQSSAWDPGTKFAICWKFLSLQALSQVTFRLQANYYSFMCSNSVTAPQVTF